MIIKIFGPGCKRCTQTLEIVKKAVSEAAVECSVEKISDFGEFAKYGVTATPTVMVNGVIKSSGKIPSIDDVKAWL